MLSIGNYGYLSPERDLHTESEFVESTTAATTIDEVDVQIPKMQAQEECKVKEVKLYTYSVQILVKTQSGEVLMDTTKLRKTTSDWWVTTAKAISDIIEDVLGKKGYTFYKDIYGIIKNWSAHNMYGSVEIHPTRIS